MRSKAMAAVRIRPSERDWPWLGSRVLYQQPGPDPLIMPAIVTATMDTLSPAAVTAGCPLLDSLMHVHLIAFPPPGFEPTVQAHNVRYAPAGGPDTWHWPPAAGWR